MNHFTRIAVAGVVAVFTSASAQAQQRGQNGIEGQQGGYHSGYGQMPWFSNLEIRQHFKLSDQQYNQLNKSYSTSYGRYQQDMKAFDKDLSAEQRARENASCNYVSTRIFSTSTTEVFTDPEQRQRYNQVYLQYQGYDAFADPTVQEKLNLTSEQRTKLGRYGQEWHKQMNNLGHTDSTDRDAMTKQFNEMRKQSRERINTVLNPEQRTSWQQLTGELYNFRPNSYFHTNTGAGTKKNPK